MKKYKIAVFVDSLRKGSAIKPGNVRLPATSISFFGIADADIKTSK